MSAVPIDQRAEATHDPIGTLGMWVFLATEVLFFGALFTAFITYRNAYPESFAASSRELDVMLGTINTAVLLTSSFTMALAVLAARLQRTRMCVVSLLATVFFGVVFLCIKGAEYAKEFGEHLAPWRSDANFALAGGTPAHNRLFFDFYFVMTGLHAVHLLIGMLLVLVVAWLSTRKRSRIGQVVEATGLYWHFVDVVWVFLYPLLYLSGR